MTELALEELGMYLCSGSPGSMQRCLGATTTRRFELRQENFHNREAREGEASPTQQTGSPTKRYSASLAVEVAGVLAATVPLGMPSGKTGHDRARTLLVMMHVPWYNSNTHHTGEAELMRLAMEPLLYTYGVDMVVTGHVHSYERIRPCSTAASIPARLFT